MVNQRVCLLAGVLAVLTCSSAASAKGPVVELVVSGPDLPEPIAITDPDAIDVQVYGATFIEAELGSIDEVASSPIPPYIVQFLVSLPPDNDVQMKYVVYYRWDWERGRGRVYFPGRNDAWWRHNVFTVALPFEGAWYWTTESWGEAVRDAILDHTDPRVLANQGP